MRNEEYAMNPGKQVPETKPAPAQGKVRQLLWFVGLWVLGVLAMGAIAGAFRFFAQFAYQ